MKTAFLHISAQSYIYIFCFTTTLHTPPRNPTRWRVLCRIYRPNHTHLPLWLSRLKPKLCRVWRKCMYPWKTYRCERWIRARGARILFTFFCRLPFCVHHGTSFAVSPPKNTMWAQQPVQCTLQQKNLSLEGYTVSIPGQRLGIAGSKKSLAWRAIRPRSWRAWVASRKQEATVWTRRPAFLTRLFWNINVHELIL